MRVVALTLAGLIAIAAAPAFAGAGTPAPLINPTKIVDLTHTFDSTTIYWPDQKGLVHQYMHFGMEPGGYFYAEDKISAPVHGGTHMDAPLHFNRSGMTADQVALKDCIGPAAVIDFSARALKNPNDTLSVADISKYEKTYGRIPDGAIVVARSGWGRFWPNKLRYMGTDKPGDVKDLHFPGWSPAAVEFLLKHRNVAAIAIDTASMDPGDSKDFPVHRLWLGADKPGFENVANADRLPARGATIFCIPMKLGKGTGAPTRIFAVLP